MRPWVLTIRIEARCPACPGRSSFAAFTSRADRCGASSAHGTRFGFASADLWNAGDAHLPGCLLAYASDMAFVSTLALAHSDKVKRDQLMMASLDHALWLHRPVPIDDWLLFVKRATTARGGRGMNHAEVFARDGSLVASVSQEGLVRLRKPRETVAAG